MIIALVHFGKSLPSYAKQNILLIDKTFEDLTKILINDSPKHKKFLSKTGFESRTTSLPTELENISSLSHDLHFRKGFWFTSLYRLIAICELAEERDGPILHIENDILLFPNFPISKLEESKKIMWCQFNDQRDVASLFYIPDSKSAKWLKNELLTRYRAYPAHTDMSLLREIADLNPSRVNYFPIAEKVESALFRKDVDNESKRKNIEGFNYYGGIFDSAPLGMYWIGRDPRNHKGKLLRFTNLPESFIMAESSLFNFNFSKPEIKLKSISIPIYNLHVHAKIPGIFSKSGIGKYRVVAGEIDGKSKPKFMFKIFMLLSFSYLRRKLQRNAKKLLANQK